MDELLQEFLGETGEHLDMVDRELVRFEQEPNNGDILRNIFRLVHTVKGTCGFIGLPRLEALTHAAESVIGQFRDGASVSSTAVTAILETIDRIKEIMAELAEKGQEPPGHDGQLIDELRGLAERAKQELAVRQPQPGLDPVAAYLARSAEARSAETAGPATVGGASDEMDLVFRMAPSPLDQPGQAHGDARNAGPATLRVNVDTLEHLMTMVSELELTRNQLLEIARRQEDAGLKGPLQRLSLITAELQDGVMKTRMQPIGNAWSKLPRIVRDLSSDLGKKIELVMEGEDTELDKTMIECLADPLVHLIRNAIDHGIEDNATRAANGKTEQGRIELAAVHSGAQVLVTVKDNGGGLNTARIRAKAEEQGLIAAGAVLTDHEIHQFLFHPGFSTAQTISALSGRGVGMDVVKRTIENMRGSIDLSTRPGQGTTVTLRLPLTLAIIEGLLIRVGEGRYIIPLPAVEECVELTAEDERSRGRNFLNVRGNLVPFLRLRDILSAEGTPDQHQKTIIISTGETQVGLVADQIIGNHQTVIKSLSKLHSDVTIFSGATILGDGTAALILDVAQLVALAQSKVEKHISEAA